MNEADGWQLPALATGTARKEAGAAVIYCPKELPAGCKSLLTPTSRTEVDAGLRGIIRGVRRQRDAVARETGGREGPRLDEVCFQARGGESCLGDGFCARGVRRRGGRAKLITCLW